MNKIKTVLVDDEAGSREVLANLLERHFPEIEIVGQASNVDEAFIVLNTTMPQLVFLDVQMPKASGFDLLKKFPEIPFEIVFVTSFDKYAINAIKFSALDYLLKPIEVEEMKNTIQKVRKSLELKTHSGTQIVNLIHSLEGDIKDRKIAVHAGGKVKLLSEMNIIYIEGEGRYTHITTLNTEVYTTAKNLKEFEEYFEQKNNFIRINKSIIININQIKHYSKGEPCIIEMVNERSFDVARRKKSEILEMLKKNNL